MKVHKLAVVVAAAGLSLVMAGCSGSSSSNTGATSSGSGSSTGPGSVNGNGSGSSATGSGSGGGSHGTASQLTGAQLTKALLPANDFPSRFAVSEQGSADSGASLEKGSASYNPATMSCTEWDNYFTSSGFGETAYTAQSVANSAADQAYGQVVYQFASSGAASTFFSGVQSLSARCHSFTASGGGSDHVSMQLTSAASVAGHQTFWLDQSTAVAGATSKINTLFAVAGTDVFAISASAVGSTPPSDPAPASLLQRLITNVEAHRSLLEE
ncbi:MAG TPA: hypothetical protein VFB06_07155 [Streptosporangiaceae bacterium]|nr:hypothetical protein [Streptosporangiaceae bacterium]